MKRGRLTAVCMFATLATLCAPAAAFTQKEDPSPQYDPATSAAWTHRGAEVGWMASSNPFSTFSSRPSKAHPILGFRFSRKDFKAFGAGLFPEVAAPFVVLVYVPRFTDKDLEAFRSQTNLVYLALQRTQVTGAGFQRFKGFDKLTQLSTTASPIDDDGVKAITRFKKLRYLSLYGARISDDGVKELTKLTELTHLLLPYTALNDRGLEELKALASLEKLWLGGT